MTESWHGLRGLGFRCNHAEEWDERKAREELFPVEKEGVCRRCERVEVDEEDPRLVTSQINIEND